MADVEFHLDSGDVVEVGFFDNDSASIAVDSAMVTGVWRHDGDRTTVYPPHRIFKVIITWGFK